MQDYENFREKNCKKKNKSLAAAISSIEEYKIDPVVSINLTCVKNVKHKTYIDCNFLEIQVERVSKCRIHCKD